MGEGQDEMRLQEIEEFKRKPAPSSAWQYSFRDTILYALSVGCQRTERKFVYENDTDFATLPTFAVVAVHKAKLDYQHLLPNFDPVSKLLYSLRCKFMACAYACGLGTSQCQGLHNTAYVPSYPVGCPSCCWQAGLEHNVANCRGSCCMVSSLCRSSHPYQ